MKDRILNALMLLAVAAALGLTLSRGEPEIEPLSLPQTSIQASAPSAAPDPVAAYREERAKSRRQDMEGLAQLAQSASSAPETRALAEAQLLDMAKNDEIELAVEAALAARGYENGLCVARAGEITVFVPRAMAQEDAALILEMAQAASGLGIENIRISGYAF